MTSPTLPENQQTLCAAFTSALETTPGLSFVRLGDGELKFLLKVQAGEWNDTKDGPRAGRAGIEFANVHSGLKLRDHARLLQAFERAGWVDLYQNQTYNASRLPELQWRRPSELTTVSEPALGGFILRWCVDELPAYVARHRTLWCGAESRLLETLMADSDYRAAAGNQWPAGIDMRFCAPPNGGRTLSEDLDRLLEILVARVRSENIHTVFLALGGLAKIVAYELATATGARCVDIGGAMRGFCYAGSDGHITWRSSHSPFFFRLPLRVYWHALLAVSPGLTADERLSKAHAQLALDLQRKTVGTTSSADLHDSTSHAPTAENLAAFYANLAFYHHHILPSHLLSPAAVRQALEFALWRWKKNLGVDGRAYQRLRRLKHRLTRQNP